MNEETAPSQDSGNTSASASVSFGLSPVAAILIGVALLLSVLAVAMGSMALTRATELGESAADVQAAAVNAAVAAERADKAERSAALSRLYAVQVYPELARLGYPVNTPAGAHEPVPPEAYENHDRFAASHLEGEGQ